MSSRTNRTTETVTEDNLPEHVSTSFTKDELAGITSFEDAQRLAAGYYGHLESAHESELGDGFKVADEDDKRRLIGVPLFFLEWTFRDGDFGKEYVSIRAVAQESGGSTTKWIINDGGTGICKELRGYQDKTKRTGGLMVRNGLRVSDYPTDPNTGTPLTKLEVKEYIKQDKKMGKGHTFYIDTSA